MQDSSDEDLEVVYDEDSTTRGRVKTAISHKTRISIGVLGTYAFLFEYYA